MKTLFNLLMIALFVACARQAILSAPDPVVVETPISPGITPTPLPVPTPVATAPQVPVLLSPTLKKWCDRTDVAFARYGWGKSRCEEFPWNHVRNSADGHPLAWLTFGEEVDVEKKNVTIIMCGVHGDEITPMKFCYDIIHDLHDFVWDLKDRLVVVVPLVCPDSFFRDKPTRTNGRGVDVNRNFPTADWNADALRLWKHKYRSDKRRNPGMRAGSEAETVFQVNLIKRYHPSKIVSVHSPLMLLDYDGPDLRSDGARLANDLLLSMSEKAKGYKVSDYPHFPGSLGNWAGKERNIPTYTLELPNTNPKEHERFWKLFREAIHDAIEKPMGFNERTSDVEVPSP